MKARIREAGAEFCDYGSEVTAQMLSKTALLHLQLLPACQVLLPTLQAQLSGLMQESHTRGESVVLLADPMALWSMLLSHLYPALRLVLCYPILVGCRIASSHMSQHAPCCEAAAQLVAEYNLPFDPVRLLNHPRCTGSVVLFGKSLQPLNQRFLSSSSHVTFMGPALLFNNKQHSSTAVEQKKDNVVLTEIAAKLNQGNFHNTVYISLGTLVKDPHMLRALFDAFVTAFPQDLFIMSTSLDRKQHASLRASLPVELDNMLLYDHVPQPRVLALCDLFITHGGLNSIVESCLVGVPLLLIPCFGDQFYNSSHAAHLHVGLQIDKTAAMDPGQVEQHRTKYKSLISHAENNKFRQALKVIQAELQSYALPDVNNQTGLDRTLQVVLHGSMSDNVATA
jgi:UDP:flavonoid glycosyltransferase YjiC (YdhE family)